MGVLAFPLLATELERLGMRVLSEKGGHCLGGSKTASVETRVATGVFIHWAFPWRTLPASNLCFFLIAHGGRRIQNCSGQVEACDRAVVWTCRVKD